MKNPLRIPFSIYQKLIERCYSREDSCGRILMFHDVYSDSPIIEGEYAISKNNFEIMIDSLQQKYSFPKIESYDDIIKMDGNCVVLTFDDFFESVVKNAIPVLRQRNIPFIVFAADKYIGTQGYVSTEDLDNLKSDSLCTIGYHSATHSSFRFRNRKLMDEVERINHEERLFAFPYGSVFAVSRKNREILREASSFDCAFSTINSDLTERNKGERFFLPRRNVNDSNYLTMI